ncbi:hypothetical protein TCAL_10152 [Tigriopus californicus]|uniref:R3H domain-containing protein n=1 Tax=Tigriopus californicus TaxID=6832 RepID=A0A553PF17_TIGCA|nr:sperm-associated antigen 7 homolog [Tigriopus californicus]XP_059083636.1 sperm-associated antigen 7 homolog [Tigriopus californicus]XP_059083637.1 sperm-associated antigen 7 homolog [Tigriopus californicus]TRY76266.1 hypothetical protein TCAL_10152 [Tigriopus californicus]|eukprot:TCALIF_10152-PA protein Name:"Similar to Spag7 Sperm-associated antigen 7 (Mus musculus)" AED:0.20 eAED:0.24 QI:0/-1/0/1/-1/1/1/0/224
MDLLNSIMSKMDKPPVMTDQEKEKRKKAKEMAKKMEEKHKKATHEFRNKIEKVIEAFVEDSQAHNHTFAPMEKVQRSIVHDVAETAGLVTYSFGEEDVDRHLVIWKKDFQPNEDELTCRRAGQVWDPETYYQQKQEAEQHALKEEIEARKRQKQKVVPKGNYHAKYEHIIGNDTMALQRTELKKSYGMVSSDQKKDRRTVEDIQAELRAKKRMKLDTQSEDSSK